MKRVIPLRLLTGTLILALATTLVACEESQVKPQEQAKQKSKVFPNGVPPKTSPGDGNPPPRVTSVMSRENLYCFTQYKFS